MMPSYSDLLKTNPNQYPIDYAQLKTLHSYLQLLILLIPGKNFSNHFVDTTQGL